MKILVNNKKAYFDYEILEKVEAGIELKGWEVKSLKSGSMNITNAFVRELGGEMFLLEARIPVWKTSNYVESSEEYRRRRLLLKKNEIRALSAKSKESRATIVPLEFYQNDKGLIKVLIGLAKGKRKYDKRQKIKERELARRINEERKHFNF
jgi:SsrA-binding protein